MNYSRLLTHSNEDLVQLKTVLDSFVNDQHSLTRPLRITEHSKLLAARIIDEFNEANKDSVYISGSFINDRLVTICVGMKFYPYIKSASRNALPSWIMLLIYSTEPKLNNPSQKIFEAGTHLVRKMEEDGLYTFYQTFKFPNYKTIEKCRSYIDSSFSKMTIMDRYINLLEYIHNEDDTYENIPFNFFKHCIGRVLTHNRKICITSHHLKNEYRNFKIS